LDWEEKREVEVVRFAKVPTAGGEEEVEEVATAVPDGPAPTLLPVLAEAVDGLEVNLDSSTALLTSLSLLTATRLLFSLNARSRSFASKRSPRVADILVNSSRHSWRATSSS
jgi:hypothetical protein